MSFSSKKIGVMDTSIATENTGDMIIMDGARRELEAVLLPFQQLIFPTHEKLSAHSYKLQKMVKYNVACGTNLLHSHMGIIKQWNIGCFYAYKIKPVILFGVGWRSNPKRKTDIFTKWLLKKILSKKKLHSVRDSYAMKQLKNIGITNVVNTGCPTTWILTENHCSAIPAKKGKDAVVVLTDYSRDVSDAETLDFVCANYRRVYFWCQGAHDHEYLMSLGYSSRVEVIPSSLVAYHNLLKDSSLSLDYVGTRLHGGIYALKHKRRSVIIGVDHRANEMGRDLNLPVVSRYAPEGELEKVIINDLETKVRLPIENIEKWKAQFKIEE